MKDKNKGYLLPNLLICLNDSLISVILRKFFRDLQTSEDKYFYLLFDVNGFHPGNFGEEAFNKVNILKWFSFFAVKLLPKGSI